MNTLDTQIRSAVVERASEWFTAHRAGTMGEPERTAFFSWLKTSPMHVEEYLSLAALEGELSSALTEPVMSLQALRELSDQGADEAIGMHRWLRDVSSESAPAQRIRPWLAVLAIVLVVGLGITVWLSRGDGPAQAQTYRTAHGGQGSWRLADGSVLQLDTDSAVSVRFSRGERHVSLEQGQALFQVAHDTRRPFRVAIGPTAVVAVGTQFDIYRRADATVVTVLEGRVRVSSALPAPLAASETRLDAGQQLSVRPGASPGLPVRVDASSTVAWLHRQIAFDHQSMAEVAQEFNRYNKVLIIIEDPALRSVPISGVFNAYDLDSFAAFLASLEGVEVQRSADAIRVSRRAAHAASAARTVG